MKTALLTTKEAAEFMAVSPETLKDWRTRQKRGPKYVKFPSPNRSKGRVRYRLCDLEEFAEGSLVTPNAA